MLWYDCVQLIRSIRFTHILVILIGAILYHQAIYTNEAISSGIGLFTALPQQAMYISIAVFPVFLCNLCILEVLGKRETLPLRSSLLAYPIRIRSYAGRTLLVLCLLQVLLTVISCTYMFLLHAAITPAYLMFLTLLQGLMLIQLLYTSFYTASGILYESVKNPMKLLMGAFIALCIWNADSWITAFSNLYIPLMMFLMVCLFYFFIRLPKQIFSKFENELVLHKLFHGVLNPAWYVTQYRLKHVSDTVLQRIFRRCDRHKKEYWRHCAVIEVVFRKYVLDFLLMLAFLYISIVTKQYSFILVSIGLFLSLWIHYRKEKRYVRCVRIIASSNN